MLRIRRAKIIELIVYYAELLFIGQLHDHVYKSRFVIRAIMATV